MQPWIAKNLRYLLISGLFGVPAGKLFLAFMPTGLAVLCACFISMIFCDSSLFPLNDPCGRRHQGVAARGRVGITEDVNRVAHENE